MDERACGNVDNRGDTKSCQVPPKNKQGPRFIPRLRAAKGRSRAETGLRIYAGARTTGAVLREGAKTEPNMAKDVARRVLELARATADAAMSVAISCSPGSRAPGASSPAAIRAAT